MSEAALKLQEKKRIIVIDDDEVSRMILKKSLGAGYDVLAFESFSEVIHCVEADRPFAIMVDIFMPNIDGFEVLSLLRHHPATSATPIICMSGTESEEIRSRLESLGASAFIKKPFNVSRLSADITAIIQSLNKVISSKNAQRTFTIAHNDSERMRLIREAIDQGSRAQETLVVLSWTPGHEFFGDKVPSSIADQKVIFLEMKPQLIIKFPYLVEMSSVIHDLMGFLDPNRTDYHVIFDEVRNLLNLNDGERTLAKAYALAHALRPLCRRQSYFSTQPTLNQNGLFLQKIARVFVEGESD